MAFADCLTVFLLAVVHLVLVHGWDVLRVVPLVPGVQPEDAVALVPFPPFSVGRFFSLWPVAWLAMDACCIFIFCSPLLDWVSCFPFFLRPLLFHFLDPWTRACARTLTLSLARTLSLSLAGVHFPSCPHGFSLWFPRSFPHFLVARLSPILEGLLAFGGGWGSDSTPSSGCGWAVLGASVFVLCVLVGWA